MNRSSQIQPPLKPDSKDACAERNAETELTLAQRAHAARCILENAMIWQQAEVPRTVEVEQLLAVKQLIAKLNVRKDHDTLSDADRGEIERLKESYAAYKLAQNRQQANTRKADQKQHRSTALGSYPRSSGGVKQRDLYRLLFDKCKQRVKVREFVNMAIAQTKMTESSVRTQLSRIRSCGWISRERGIVRLLRKGTANIRAFLGMNAGQIKRVGSLGTFESNTTLRPEK